MFITLKCYATLRHYQPEEAEHLKLPPGTSVEVLLQRLGIDSREVKLIFVNNKSASRTTLLEEGDTVGLFPAVGGG